MIIGLLVVHLHGTSEVRSTLGVPAALLTKDGCWGEKRVPADVKDADPGALLVMRWELSGLGPRGLAFWLSASYLIFRKGLCTSALLLASPLILFLLPTAASQRCAAAALAAAR